jgi:CubicO group peptidase (beta-lactamase class C family)
MTTRLRFLSVIAVAVCMLTLAACVTDAAPRPAPLNRQQEGLLQKDLDLLVGDPSGVSAIAEVRRGEVVWRGGSGPATLHGPRPAPVDGSFRADSVTKSFTAVVVLQLVTEQRLRLTDSIERWLPGLLPHGERITIEHLLRHTSGLHEYAEGTFTDAESLLPIRYRTWTPRELVELAVRRLPDPAPQPGSFAYSNTDYILLGMIIDRVTGRSYQQEMTARILQPLGLRHTSLPGLAVQLPRPHAHGYLQVLRDGRPTDVDITQLNMTFTGAAGELVSTTADLNQFYAALLAGDLLPSAQLQAMQTGTGIGMEEAPLACGPVYGHGGGVPGYSTMSFSSADGSRQVTVSITTSHREIGFPLALRPPVMTLLDHALCPSA